MKNANVFEEMENVFISETLHFIEKIYETDVPSVDLSFLRGQLYSLYELNAITYDEYHKHNCMLICARKQREQCMIEYNL